MREPAVAKSPVVYVVCFCMNIVLAFWAR